MLRRRGTRRLEARGLILRDAGPARSAGRGLWRRVGEPQGDQRGKPCERPCYYLTTMLINRQVKEGPLKELKVRSLPVCESCLEGQKTKRSFSTKGERVKEPLELIHSDVCGPLNVQARGGYEYFVTFIDDYSRYGYIYLMQRKSETFENFKEFQAEAEKQLGKMVKSLRSDRG